MTPEEKKLIAHMVKLIMFTPNNEIKKVEAHKELIDLAEAVGLKKELVSTLQPDRKHPASSSPPLATVESDPDVQRTIKNIKNGMTVPDLYVECVAEKGDIVYTILESALEVSRPVALRNAVVLKKREAVGRDDVEIFELQIGEMVIQKVKEDKDGDS